MFQDCEIMRMEQRTPEWHEARKGVLTASKVGAWLAEEPKNRMKIDEMKKELSRLNIEFPSKGKADEFKALLPADPSYLSETDLTKKARRKSIIKCLSTLTENDEPEEYQVDPDGPPPLNRTLWAIWNGIRREPEAEESFLKETGLEAEKVGFCLHKSLVAGCSPDLLIKGKNEGFEGKAPLEETHLAYLLDDCLPSDYVDQVHFSMAVTGADAWWFQSWHQNHPSLIIRTKRDEYTEAMVRGIAIFEEELVRTKAKLAEIWERKFDGKEAA